MLPVNLNDLNAAHIESLIESEVPESLTLDYKQQLPSKGSDDRKEFLYDVAAMANSAGGDLVYGIAERRTKDDKATGIPDRLLGTRFSNPQEEEIRLFNYITNSISPKLIGAIARSVRCEGGDALVVRVPVSRSKPHMVTMERTNKFYKRTGTVSHPMAWDEIRRAFSEQSELRESITMWRAHRVDLIEQKRGPVLLNEDVVMLFHVIPADAFTTGGFTEAWRIPGDEKKDVHVPNGNYYQRYNADGFLCHSNLAIVGSPLDKDARVLRIYATVSLGDCRVRLQPFLSPADGFAVSPDLRSDGGANHGSLLRRCHWAIPARATSRRSVRWVLSARNRRQADLFNDEIMEWTGVWDSAKRFHVARGDGGFERARRATLRASFASAGGYVLAA